MTQKTTAVYVAGPMRGLPAFNYPAFNSAAADLRARGFTVFNPAENDQATQDVKLDTDPTGDLGKAVQAGFSLREALAADMQWIALHADALYMLHGWEASAGARAEHALASALGLKIYYQRNDI